MRTLLTALGSQMLVFATPAFAQSDSPFGETIADFGGAQLQNRDWLSFRDYPTVAIRDGIEGRVVIAFDITVEGRATNCRVEKSSGHAVLDRVPCRPFERKARLTPAMQHGAAVPTKGRLSLDFWMPQPPR